MRWPAAAMVLLLVLSGCAASDEGKTSDTSTTTSGTSTPATDGTGPAPGPDNRAPTAELLANVTTGAAPLAVRLTLKASDPDGNPLSWRLDVAGQPPATGSELPATVDRTFAAGTWQVELKVTDGAATVSDRVTVLATGAAAEPPIVLNGTVKGIDPSANATVAGHAGACRLGDPATPGGPIGGGWHDLPAQAADRDYSISPPGHFAAYFTKADGTGVGTGGDVGIVPMDATQVRICTADPQAGGTYTFTAVVAFRLASSAFAHGARIPAKHTCDGADTQPPLEIRRAPDGTRHFALILEDPDAPGGMFIHWVWWDLPATVTSLPEDADMAKLGAREGPNDFGEDGWGGPCPPPTTHRYHFRLFALSAPLGLNPGATANQVRTAMEGKVMGETTLLGLYP